MAINFVDIAIEMIEKQTDRTAKAIGVNDLAVRLQATFEDFCQERAEAVYAAEDARLGTAHSGSEGAVMPTSYVISRHGVSTYTPEHPYPGVRSSIRICWDVPDDTAIELSHEGQATTATVSLADLRAMLEQREIETYWQRKIAEDNALANPDAPVSPWERK